MVPVFGTADVASEEHCCWCWSKDESAGVELSGVVGIEFETLVGVALLSDLYNISAKDRIDSTTVKLTLPPLTQLEGSSPLQAQSSSPRGWH